MRRIGWASILTLLVSLGEINAQSNWQATNANRAVSPAKELLSSPQAPIGLPPRDLTINPEPTFGPSLPAKETLTLPQPPAPSGLPPRDRTVNLEPTFGPSPPARETLTLPSPQSPIGLPPRDRTINLESTIGPSPTRPESLPDVHTPPTVELLPFEEKALASSDAGWTPRFKFKPGDEHLLNMETENKEIKFYVGGRLQLDLAFMYAGKRTQFGRDGVGRLDDAVNPRRARYDFGGTLFENIDFLMEWDFINTANAERAGNALPINTPVPTDQWVRFKNIPIVGNLQIGNMKNPIALEHMTSSRFLSFLERSLAFDAFIENQNNGFEPGIMLFNTYVDQRVYGAIGVFKNTRSIFGWNVGDGEYDLTGRIACLPIWEEDGRYLLHLGIGASHADLDDHVARYRARILIRNGPAVLHNIVAEAQVVGSSRDMIVPEFAMNYGPFTLSAEYYAVWTHDVQTPVVTTGPRTDRGTTYFQGGYVEALYFLTGEHRGYDRGSFRWTRVTPNRNWKPWGSDSCDAGGIGAWQIAARYDWVNLNDNGVHGNIVHDWTLGLNWFLNPYMKFQWNYTLEYRSAQFNKGYIQAFGTRLAMDF